MLPKTPKPQIWKFVKGSAKTLFVIEAVAFAVSYGVYHRMNTNREFRLYINENYPIVLNTFYKIGETFGDKSTRQTDAAVWSVEQAKSK